MPTQGQQFEIPGNARVSGWGALEEGGSERPEELQAVTVPLVTDEGTVYNRMYLGYFRGITIVNM